MTTFRSIFTDRRFLLGTPGRTLFLLAAFNVAVAWHKNALDNARLANLLLAPKPLVTTPAVASVRYDVSIGDSLGKILPAIPDARSNSLVILAGMSQMYAINEPRPGDETISEHLDDMWRPLGTRVFGLAAPNLDNEEALFLLLTSMSRPETTPAVFIYGVCFDKMRFVDIRPQYLALIREQPAVRALLDQTAHEYRGRLPLASAKLRTTLASLDASSAEEDKSLEHRLRDKVGDVIPMVGSRKELNTYLLYNVLYTARNKLLRISNSTKRPIMPARYDLNKEFLAMMIDAAQRHNVHLMMYINPLNPQADNPYVPAEYEEFKQWARRLADSTAVPFADLEAAVPRDDWGFFMGGPDFMHFKGTGHLAAALAIASAFGPQVRALGRPRGQAAK